MMTTLIQDGDFVKVTLLSVKSGCVGPAAGTEYVGIVQDVERCPITGCWFNVACDDGGLIGFLAEDTTIAVELLERAER